MSEARRPRNAGPALLRATGLGRTLGNGRRVIADLDLDLRQGEVVTIQGPTGSGKTLLLRMLAGLDAVEEGSVELDATPQDEWRMPEYRTQVLYLPQTPVLPAETVAESCREPFGFKVRSGIGGFQRAAAIELLAAAGRDEDFLDASTRGLSGGEQQIAALTRALLCEPRVLLLDEPTAALDPESQQAVERLVSTWQQERTAAVLWVTHDVDQARRVADRRLELLEGRLK